MITKIDIHPFDADVLKHCQSLLYEYKNANNSEDEFSPWPDLLITQHLSILRMILAKNGYER